MKYGLSAKQQTTILHILAAQPEVEQGILFGSRAVGNYKLASDIDLAIKGKQINAKTLFRLRDAFEDSDLPFFVDVVDYQTIDNLAFKRHIDTQGIVIFSYPVNNNRRAV